MISGEALCVWSTKASFCLGRINAQMANAHDPRDFQEKQMP